MPTDKQERTDAADAAELRRQGAERAAADLADEKRAAKRGTADPRAKADPVPASEKTVASAVKADKPRLGKPTAGPEPPLFHDELGEHEETGKAQAAVASGDGTVNVWPPQPTASGATTLDAEGNVLRDGER